MCKQYLTGVVCFYRAMNFDWMLLRPDQVLREILSNNGI